MSNVPLNEKITTAKAFRGNKAIKGTNVTEYVDKETFEFRTREIVKCKDSIHYFAEHYYTIVNLDRGKEIIKLFDKQRGLLSFFTNNKRCVVLSSRQSSKCVRNNSKITIRNKHTGEINNITIEEFQKLASSLPTSK